MAVATPVSIFPPTSVFLCRADTRTHQDEDVKTATSPPTPSPVKWAFSLLPTSVKPTRPWLCSKCWIILAD